MTNPTSYHAFFFGTAICLALAAAVSAPAETAPATQVVKLERVVIEGKRTVDGMQVVRLPQVVVEGRSIGAEQRLALAKTSCPAQTVC